MKTILMYLDELKEKTGSDYKTAKLLKLTKEGVCKVRSRGQCSDETALKMAELLEEPQENLLIAAAIARSNETVKKAWENISRKAGIAASIYLAIGWISPNLLNTLNEGFERVYCILCKIRNELNKLKFIGLISWLHHEFLLFTKRSRTDKETSSHFI